MGGTARRRGRRKAAERDLSALNWAEVAESHQGRRQGPAARPEAGAGLRWAAGGRGSAPGRRTEPRPSARSGSCRSVLERLSHGPAASVFSVAGALSCLHHHQRPTASLPALSFFPCQYSLHFYRDAFFRILVRLAFRRPPVSRGVTGKWLCDMAAPRCRNVFAWLQLSALARHVLRGGHGLSCCGAPVRLPAPRGRGRSGAFSAVPGLTPPARHVSSTDSNAGTCRGGLCFTSPLCAPASPFVDHGSALRTSASPAPGPTQSRHLGCSPSGLESIARRGNPSRARTSPGARARVTQAGEAGMQLVKNNNQFFFPKVNVVIFFFNY